MKIDDCNKCKCNLLFCIICSTFKLYLYIVRVNYMTLRYFFIVHHNMPSYNCLTLTIQNIMMCQLSITYQQFSMLCIFWENQINHFYFSWQNIMDIIPKNYMKNMLQRHITKDVFLIRWKLNLYVLQTRFNTI